MFFTFDQNNSGGRFQRDSHVSNYVIVEADSSNEANERAEFIGVYFDGCANGLDCSCCGDRWSRAWHDDGTETPTIYGQPVEGYNAYGVSKGEVYAYIYRKDGVVEVVSI